MMIILLSALVTFGYVFVRAMQQLNVVGGHYWRVPIVSLAMGVGDVLLVTFIVKSGTLWLGVTNGLSGAVGCMLAMWLNGKLRK